MARISTYAIDSTIEGTRVLEKRGLKALKEIMKSEGFSGELLL